MIGNKNKRNSIVQWFCAIIVLTLCIHVWYSCHTANVLAESQEKIIKEHISHIAKVDSIYFCMKEVILASDSEAIVNAPKLLSQLHKDSALFRKEVLLSQEELNNLIELHLVKIDNGYDQINMWFGVAGVIFLILGFYGIFKIEESKKHAEDLVEEFRDDVQQKADEVLNDIQGKVTPLQNALEDFNAKNSQFDQYAQNAQEQINLLNQQFSSSLERTASLEARLKQIIKEAEKLKADLESLLK